MKNLRKNQTPEDKNEYNIGNKERMQKTRKKQIKCKTELDRLLAFKTATRYGPIFICSSCHQKMFQNNVSILDENLTNKIKKQSIDLYHMILANNIQEIELHTKNGKKNQKYQNLHIFVLHAKDI